MTDIGRIKTMERRIAELEAENDRLRQALDAENNSLIGKVARLLGYASTVPTSPTWEDWSIGLVRHLNYVCEAYGFDWRYELDNMRRQIVEVKHNDTGQ